MWGWLSAVLAGLTLSLSACTFDMDLRSLSASVHYIDQDGGTQTVGNKIRLEGTSLNHVASVLIGSYVCIISDQSESELQCTLMASLVHGIYPVALQMYGGAVVQLPEVRYFAGAVTIGTPDFASSGRKIEGVLNPNDLKVFDDALVVVNRGAKNNDLISAYDSSLQFKYRFFDPTEGLFSSTKIRPPGISREAVSVCRGEGQVFVADTTHRILVFDEVDFGQEVKSARYVIGQTDFTKTTANAGITPDERTLKLDTVSTLFCYGDKLYVSDTGNNRILIFQTPISQNFPSATGVLGQNDFTSVQTNRGSANAAANSLNGPMSVWADQNYIYVTDRGNHRVLIYEASVASGGDALKVLGQTNFTNRSTGNTQSKFRNPRGLTVHNDTLYVVDSTNNRVMYFDISDVPGLTNGALAQGVLGQDDFTATTANKGQEYPSLGSLWAPSAVVEFQGKLFVADVNNSRLLYWEISSLASSSDAQGVLGQPDGTSNSYDTTVSAQDFSSITQLRMAGSEDHVWATTFQEARVLRVSQPDENYKAADLVLGQPDFTSSFRYPSPHMNGARFGNIQNIFYSNQDGSLIISDTSNDRVLIWNTAPTTSNEPADVVLGQPDMTTIAINVASDVRFAGPIGVCRTSQYLFVADSQRVLRFSYPLTSGMAADLVLGQGDFTSNTINGGSSAVNSQGFSNPWGLYCDDDRLMVVDAGNNRVMLWNTLPVVNNQAADLVLGQKSFLTKDCGVGLGEMCTPRHVDYRAGNLVISDGDNERILVYRSLPAISGTEAQYSLGENYFTSEEQHFSKDNKNRVDNLISLLTVNFYDDRRLLVGVKGRGLILPFISMD